VFDAEWDLGIVVDACRFDLFSEVYSEYDCFESLAPRRSLASVTPNWMRRTFVEAVSDDLSRTTYVCGNPYSDEFAPSDRFATLREPWRTGWSRSEGTLPPRRVTDRAIDVGRRDDPDRLLVHYMQPHYPFVGGQRLGEGVHPSSTDGDLRDVWTNLDLGLVSERAVWRAYRDNLRFVLDEVELLLENVDADRAIVTSDHGNALGEWGVYGHPGDIAIDALRVVPWVEATASDSNTHDPDVGPDTGVTASVTDRLESLGYSR
jgi:hypothetical protein